VRWRRWAAHLFLTSAGLAMYAHQNGAWMVDPEDDHRCAPDAAAIDARQRVKDRLRKDDTARGGRRPLGARVSESRHRGCAPAADPSRTTNAHG
jgi:hypothetical protein